MLTGNREIEPKRFDHRKSYRNTFRIHESRVLSSPVICDVRYGKILTMSFRKPKSFFVDFIKFFNTYN